MNKNIYKMSHRERRHLRIDELPVNLSEALDELEKGALMRETLGEHIFDHFIAAKREEWDDYIRHVSPWEIERYLEHLLMERTPAVTPARQRIRNHSTFAGSRRGTHLEHVPCGSRRVTGVRKFQAGAGIAGPPGP